MIDLITFNSTLARELEKATGIQCLNDGQAAVYTGEFNDILILSCAATDEEVTGNSTYRLTMRAGYVFQPDSFTDEELTERRAALYKNIVYYLYSLPCYTDLGGAILLAVNVDPWDVTYQEQGVTYTIPFSLVV